MTSVSLIITTYNWPIALEKTLKSVLVQSRRPKEVVIADDGSDMNTTRLFQRYGVIFMKNGIRLRHSWQPDAGFRLSRSRNLAIARSTGEYIIFIDGDIIMERNFVADHLEHAEKGCFVSGRRAKLSQAYSDFLLNSNEQPSPFNSGIERGRGQAFRIPFLSKMLTNKSDSTDSIHGCNMSFWRTDAYKVNGFNTEFSGWGAEDKEFCQRLINSGIVKKKAKFSAVAFHIYHPENSLTIKSVNQKIFKDTQKHGLVWCKHGLNQFLNLNDHKPKSFTREAANYGR